MKDTVTITISKESYEFLKNLANELSTQDSRCTAEPYFFACETVEEYPTDPDFDYDRIIYYDKFGQRWDSLEELLENEPNHSGQDITEVYLKRHYRASNVFLTERAYKQHIASNGHNLKEPRSFVFHAFRNPELRDLFKFIREIGDTDEIKG